MGRGLRDATYYGRYVRWHAEFLDMWRTSGFTDRKLRIRMPAPNTGDYPAMPAPAAKL